MAKKTLYCEVHPDQKLVVFCPACRGSAGGKQTSPAKKRAAKRNAKLPRPREKEKED